MSSADTESEEDVMAPDPSPDGLLPATIRERIARAIHERYRRNQAERKPATDPAMWPWEELPKTLKESNLHQAGDIAVKLRALGYVVVPADGRDTGVELTGDEVERLAMMEHDRWATERRASGWKQGPVRDVDRKITPYLVPWGQLAEEVREYDREAVRAIPEILADVGFEIRRLSEAP